MVIGRDSEVDDMLASSWLRGVWELMVMPRSDLIHVQ